MVRIKYKNELGLLTNTKPMIAFDQVIDVVINPNILIATIFSRTAGINVQQLEAKTLAELKKNVKIELKKMGVKFEEETRHRFEKYSDEDYRDEVLNELAKDQ